MYYTRQVTNFHLEFGNNTTASIHCTVLSIHVSMRHAPDLISLKHPIHPRMLESDRATWQW
jgi:hypothetical protein